MEVHISCYDEELEYISNLNVGDRLFYKGRNRRVIGFSYNRSLMVGFVDFSKTGVAFSILKESYPHLIIEKHKTSLSEAKLYPQIMKRAIAGVEFEDAVFQLVHTLPNGAKFYRQPFSLCYITDRKYYSDWAEWDIGGLTSPVEVDFVVQDGIITSISEIETIENEK